MIVIKSVAEVEKMRRAGRVVAQCHEVIRERLRPGVTTGDIDNWVNEFLVRQGAVPTFKGYRGFPASSCVSINDEVVHGIPGDRTVEEGSIVAVDIGATLEGYVGDSGWTYAIGEVAPEVQRLLLVTEESLYKGIEQARPGSRLSDISHAVQKHAEAAGFSVVRKLCGHGVGRQMHEDPEVPNFGKPGRGPRLKVGMTLAIEPMINAGGPDVVVLPDRWTTVTADGSWSAHFEHTVAIAGNEPLILTAL